MPAQVEKFHLIFHMIFYGIYGSKKKKIFIAGDILLVFFAFLLAASIKLIALESFSFRFIMEKIDWMLVMWILLYPITFYVFELYDQDKWKYNVRLFVYISSAVLVASGIVAFISYLLLPNIVIGRTILFLQIIFTIPLLFAWRKILYKILLSKNYNNKILLIGDSPIVNKIESIIHGNNRDSGSIAVIRKYSENPGTICINGSVSSKSLFEIASGSGFNTIVIAKKLQNLPVLKKQLLKLRLAGFSIYDAPYFYETLTGKVPANDVNDTWFLFQHHGEQFNPAIYQKIKKIIDKIIAIIGIILSSPLMLFAALSIKISSKGPIFFKQKRVGHNGREFTLIKFRTMVDNAEANTGPVWAQKNDLRITTVGKFLRKTKIDELPQLFNVLKGDMSLVGPRPIRKCFEDECCENIPFYKLRHIVKAGMTGWAQVQNFDARAEDGPMERLEYDLYYIQNQSILFDLFIVLKTVQTVLFRRGQ